MKRRFFTILAAMMMTIGTVVGVSAAPAAAQARPVTCWVGSRPGALSMPIWEGSRIGGYASVQCRYTDNVGRRAVVSAIYVYMCTFNDTYGENNCAWTEGFNTVSLFALSGTLPCIPGSTYHNSAVVEVYYAGYYSYHAAWSHERTFWDCR